MPSYDFTPVEQDVIRELGRSGFRYDRETKKTIEFVNDRTSQVINLNRELSGPALVFGFGDPDALQDVPGVVKAGSRASSNFRGLGQGTTSRGRENYKGLQVVLDGSEHIAGVVRALS